MTIWDQEKLKMRRSRAGGYFPPEEHNAWQKHQSERMKSRKRVKAATLKMKRKARALARA